VVDSTSLSIAAVVEMVLAELARRALAPGG
jgi:hypothetical protein